MLWESSAPDCAAGDASCAVKFSVVPQATTTTQPAFACPIYTLTCIDMDCLWFAAVRNGRRGERLQRLDETARVIYPVTYPVIYPVMYAWPSVVLLLWCLSLLGAGTLGVTRLFSSLKLYRFTLSDHRQPCAKPSA